MATARSGISSSFGVAKETTYGTFVAPSRFYEVYTPQPLTRKPNRQQGLGLSGGAGMPHLGRYVETTRDVDGSIPMDVVNKGMGLLWQNFFGTTAAPVQQGATAAYLQSHTLQDNLGLSLSAQGVVSARDTATLQPFSAQGLKILQLDVGNDAPDSKLMATLGINAQDMFFPTNANAKALVTPSYLTGLRPFVGTDMTIKITPAGGTQSVLAGVRKWSASLKRPMDTTIDTFGAGQVSSEQVQNDRYDISGSLDADYLVNAFTGSVTALSALFETNTAFQLVFEAKGNLIASTYYDTWRLTLPVCVFTDGNNTVTGPGIVTNTYPFKAGTNDAAAQPLLEVISADTAF